MMMAQQSTSDPGCTNAAGAGVAITGSTGEDYAEPFRNALVLDTDDPGELEEFLLELRANPALGPRLRRAGKATARAFLWSAVLPQLMARVEFAAALQGVPQTTEN